MPETIRLSELARRLGVGIDTIRPQVQKLGDDLGITPQRESRSSRAQCVSADDANKLIRLLQRDGISILTQPLREKRQVPFSGYGYFYLIQLIPELFPERIKIGYTDDLETRLREHQDSTHRPIHQDLGMQESMGSSGNGQHNSQTANS